MSNKNCCSNCGKEFAPGEKFCEYCGTKNEELAEEEVAVTEEPVVKEKKKKSKKGLFIGLGIGVAAIIVAVLVALPFLKKSDNNETKPSDDGIVETIENEENTSEEPKAEEPKAEEPKTEEPLSDLEFLKQAETVSADAVVTQVYEDVNKYNPSEIADYITKQKNSSTVSLTLSDDITKYLSTSAGIDLSFLKDVEIGLSSEKEGDNIGVLLSLGLGKQKIISADAVINPNSNTAYLTIPELSSTSMKLNIKELTGEDISAIYDLDAYKAQLEHYLSLYSGIPEMDTIKEIATRYLNLVLDNVMTVNKVEKEVTVAGKATTYTELSTEFTPDDLEKVCLALLAELKDDEALWTVIENFRKTFAPDDTSLTKEAFLAEYDEIVNSVEGSFDDADDFKYVVLVNSEGVIEGRELSGNNGDLLSYICNENGLVFEVKEQGADAMKVTFDGNLFAEVCNGTCKVYSEGKEVFTVNVENSKADFSGGKYTFIPGEILNESIAEFQEAYPFIAALGIDLTKSSLAISFNYTKDEAAVVGDLDVSLELISNGKSIIKLGADTEYNTPSGVNVPANAQNIEDQTGFVTWLSPGILGFITNLPDGLSDLVMGLMLA